MDDFGSVSGNHDGSGPGVAALAAEPTAGCGDVAGADGCSAERRSVGPGSIRSGSVSTGSGNSGAADHDGSGCRPRDRAREGSDQVFVAADSNCRNLSAEPDAGSPAGANPAR